MNQKIVCYCKNISQETIEKAIMSGAITLDDIKRMTGACTGNKCHELHPEKRCCFSDVQTILDSSRNNHT